jgi:hypothetical protein
VRLRTIRYQYDVGNYEAAGSDKIGSAHSHKELHGSDPAQAQKIKIRNDDMFACCNICAIRVHLDTRSQMDVVLLRHELFSSSWSK